VSLGLYLAVSVPALVVAGRWLKGFGKEGLTADDAEEATQTIDGLRAQLDAVTKERDEALQAARRAKELALAIAEPAGQEPEQAEPRTAEGGAEDGL